MTRSPLPAVRRARPPQGPFVVVNSFLRWVLSSPGRARRIGEHLMLLHVTGRTSGREITVPVAYRRVGGRLLVLTSATWRVNLRGGAQVAATVAGIRHSARAELVEEPETVAGVYRDLIVAEGGHRRAGRRMGIRIEVDRVPTLAELAEASRRDHLSLVHLTVEGLA